MPQLIRFCDLNMINNYSSVKCSSHVGTDQQKFTRNVELNLKHIICAEHDYTRGKRRE